MALSPGHDLAEIALDIPQVFCVCQEDEGGGNQRRKRHSKSGEFWGTLPGQLEAPFLIVLALGKQHTFNSKLVI